MNNFLLCTPELSDSATLTGSTALGDNTVGNLQKRSLSRVWRSSDETASYINIDFGEAVEIDFISIVKHNGTASGSVTIKAGTTDAVSDYNSGSLDLITGTDVGYDSNMFMALITAQTYRHWKIEIDDTGNPDGYFQAGRVYLSKAFQPTINMSYGVMDGFRDNSRVSRTLSGDGVPVIRAPLKALEVSMEFGNKDEMYGTLYDIDRLRGISKDVLFIQDPEETTHFQRKYIYGLMEETTPIVNEYFNLFQKSFKILELP